ncbi:cholinesterase-like [Dermacentor andersoni]|uniref:cholinesterase-like n=1 Tax=Dermacentor andersoni TaxID=34620 RepID=UPI002416636D|nr:cholinesterase 2-like [Dermacentor andersoni]
MRSRNTGKLDAQGLLIDATGPKPACVQSSPDKSLSAVSEDCLHLSIWTTSRECNSRDCANKAVLVFLHDGFFQTGGNRHPLYDGKYLAAYGDVVVVLPNYRLGALGFLNDGTGNAPGNVGLYDQLLALEWTRHNIGSFGGNVSNLVLVGYGAGAAAAGHLLLSRAAGVADAAVVPHRAILMSGSPFTRYPDNTKFKGRRVVDQAKRLRCMNGSRPDIRCLRAIDKRLFAKTAAPPLFFPSFTGVIPSPPRQWIQKKERITGVEILLGHMDDEGPLATLFARLVVVQQERLSETRRAAITILQAMNISGDTLKAVVHKYAKVNHLEMTALTKLLADLLVICPVRDMGRLLASAGSNRVFRYLVSTNTEANAVATKAGDMLRLVFGAHFLRPVEMATWRHASEAIIGFWTHFARTGSVPNSTEPGQGQYRITITAERETSVLDIRREQCKLLSSLGI